MFKQNTNTNQLFFIFLYQNTKNEIKQNFYWIGCWRFSFQTEAMVKRNVRLIFIENWKEQKKTIECSIVHTLEIHYLYYPHEGWMLNTMIEWDMQNAIGNDECYRYCNDLVFIQKFHSVLVSFCQWHVLESACASMYVEGKTLDCVKKNIKWYSVKLWRTYSLQEHNNGSHKVHTKLWEKPNGDQQQSKMD